MSSDSRFRSLSAPIPIKEQSWPEGLQPLVCTTTYAFNHQAYIRECLDSILMQKTTFPVHICIHDDASTDKTAEIIREYQKAYPNIIRAYFQEFNTFRHPDKIKLQSAYRSWMESGQYIAACEGDDYWLDPLKLQKQVQLLEQNPDIFLCAHDVEIVHEGVSAPKRNRFYNVPYEGNFIFDFNDYLNSHFFHTNSRVFRVPKNLAFYHKLLKRPDSSEILTNQWFLSMGKGYYIAEKMAFKRRNVNGMTNSERYHNKDFRLQVRYNLIKESLKFAPKPMRRRVCQVMGEVERQLFKRKFQQGKLGAALKYGGLAVVHDPGWAFSTKSNTLRRHFISKGIK
ncbi:glycosyltransferase [Flagellimonas marinaquae]